MLAKLQKSENELSRREIDYDSKLSELEEKVNISEKENAALVKELEEVRKDKENEDNKIKDFEERIGRLVKENEELTKTVKEFENKSLNNKNNEFENNSDELKKCKEFLKITQNHCKDLENQLKASKENVAIDAELKKKNMELQETVGVLVKEKKKLEDKERILLDTFDTLKKLDVKNNNEKDTISKNFRELPSESVIDITGEEENGGTSSKILKCNKCSFKATVESRLNQHKRDKHNQKTNNDCHGT